MTGLLIVVLGAVFLFGLIQWARGGAVLWDVIRLSKNGPKGAEKSSDQSSEDRAQRRDALRELESMTDRLLRSSFRILGVLALCVWIFVVVSVIIDLLGLDWLDNLSFQANRFWGDPTVRAGAYNSPGRPAGRDSVLRSIGSGVRR